MKITDLLQFYHERSVTIRVLLKNKSFVLFIDYAKKRLLGAASKKNDRYGIIKL